MADLLNRELGLEKNYDPTGKQWGAAKVNSEQGLWQAVIFKDGKPYRPSGLPKFLEGRFTSAERVMEEVRKFLNTQWDHAEEATRNSRAKKEQAA